MSWRALQTSLLALVLAACGGSASRGRGDSQPSSMGGVAGVGPAGEANGASAGTTGAVASGGTLGTPAGGMASAGEAPTLLLPPGCEPRAHMETADTCSLAVYCDTDSHLTSCSRLYSGRWRCECEPDKPGRIYEVENAPGFEACALAAHLCAPSELELGEERCEATTENSAEGGCQIDLACGKPFDLGADTDARAWLMRFSSAGCTQAEPGVLFACSCLSGDTMTDHHLLVESGAPDCRPLVDFCMSGGTPEYDGEQQCLLADEIVNSEGCERSEACVVPMTLRGNVSLAQVETRYASCRPLPGGGADCECSFPDWTFMFQTDAAPDAESCALSLPSCEEDAVIEATGAVSCEATSEETFHDDACRADLDCWQPATVDGWEISARGRLSLTCARSEQGMPWWCSCASDQQTTRFELGLADIDVEQACGQAPAACLEHLTVHLGPYGEFVDPPDPLSALQ